MSNEDDLQKNLFSQTSEKTYIDKVLARKDVDRIRDLVKKEILTRSDLLEMLYLISGTEAKLLNYTEWERYIVLKFFVWIREFVKFLEILFDYEEELKKQDQTCRNCRNLKDICTCGNFQSIITLTPRTRQLINNIQLLMQHNAKFMVDLYLNIARTSMSVGGSAFLEVLKTKFEVNYPTNSNLQVQPPSGGFFKKKGVN